MSWMGNRMRRATCALIGHDLDPNELRLRTRRGEMVSERALWFLNLDICSRCGWKVVVDETVLGA